MRSVTAGALLFSFLYAATAVHAAPPSDAAAPAAAKPAAKPAAKTAPAAKPATATPSAAAASAAPCHTSGTYDAWLAAFEREALTQKISQRAISTAAPHLTYDQFRIAPGDLRCP
jgi:anti-sigma factor RsiW